MPTPTLVRTLALVVVFIVIGAAVYIVSQPGNDTPAIGEDVPKESDMRTYTSSAYAFSFSYPSSYELTEREVGNSAERVHHAITLIDKVASAATPENGEGPTAITIDIYGNAIDKLPVDTWIRNTSQSNYKLSTSETLATTTTAGKVVYLYTWDGLYRGDSMVLEHEQNIFHFAVTFMDMNDAIRDDFSSIVSSLVFN